MPTALLDINVLVALAWRDHEHHQAATAWFDANHVNGWATCPITQCGFLRISCNPKVIVANFPPQQAAQSLKAITAHPHHEFWFDDLSVLHPSLHLDHLQGYRQITDAYLLVLAVSRRGTLATFDKPILAFATRCAHPPR